MRIVPERINTKITTVELKPGENYTYAYDNGDELSFKWIEEDGRLRLVCQLHRVGGRPSYKCYCEGSGVIDSSGNKREIMTARLGSFSSDLSTGTFQVNIFNTPEVAPTRISKQKGLERFLTSQMTES